jgi:hypothetical protein
MAKAPFVWLWPLKPLVGDATNRKYSGEDAKPGFPIDIEVSRERVTRQRRAYTALGREVIVEWHPKIRRYYCPAAADLEITRAWNPNGPPDDPSWLQISADLVEAGHAKNEFVARTAPEILRMLRGVVSRKTASGSPAPDTTNAHPYRHLFDSLGVAISELIDLDDKGARTGRADIVAIQKSCNRVETAVSRAHAAVESPDARAVVRKAHEAFLATADAVSSSAPTTPGQPTTSELLSAASWARGQLIIWFEEPARRPSAAAEPARIDALDSLSNQLEQFVRSRDVAERARLKSSILELSGSAERICASWGDPDDVSSAFANLTKAIDNDDEGGAARLTRITPTHSQIACWREFRKGMNRLRELSRSSAGAINVFLAYCTLALNLAEEVCHWFPFRVPKSDGVLTDRRTLEDGWTIPVEHGLLAEEISPRVVSDRRNTLLARAVDRVRSLGESRVAIPKLQRAQRALDRLGASLRKGISSGIIASKSGRELAAAIDDAGVLLETKSKKPAPAKRRVRRQKSTPRRPPRRYKIEVPGPTAAARYYASLTQTKIDRSNAWRRLRDSNGRYTIEFIAQKAYAAIQKRPPAQRRKLAAVAQPGEACSKCKTVVTPPSTLFSSARLCAACAYVAMPDPLL